MPDNAMSDNSESYEIKQQDECQSAYFVHSKFSIFAAVVCFRRNGELLHKKSVIITEAKDHLRIAALMYISKVIGIMMEKCLHLKSYTPVD